MWLDGVPPTVKAGAHGAVMIGIRALTGGAESLRSGESRDGGVTPAPMMPSMPALTRSLGRRMLNTVPEVTLWFRAIKVLYTTIGETVVDYLYENLGLGLTNTTYVVARSSWSPWPEPDGVASGRFRPGRRSSGSLGHCRPSASPRLEPTTSGLAQLMSATDPVQRIWARRTLAAWSTRWVRSANTRDGVTKPVRLRYGRATVTGEPLPDSHCPKRMGRREIGGDPEARTLPPS